MCNKSHELELREIEGMRLMTVGLILVCRREVFNAFFILIQICTFSQFCTEDVTATLAVTFASESIWPSLWKEFCSTERSCCYTMLQINK